MFQNIRNITLSSTEIKVRKATDDNESTGANGTLMSQISVLTFNNKTLAEVIGVIRKRLQSTKRSAKGSIILMKTLTLCGYLIVNGSEGFVSWLKANRGLIDRNCSFSAHNSQSTTEIRNIANKISTLLQDAEQLKNARQELNQFRNSISTPGRKSTDNSHLEKKVVTSRDVRARSLEIARRGVRPSMDRSRYALGTLSEET